MKGFLKLLPAILPFSCFHAGPAEAPDPELDVPASFTAGEGKGGGRLDEWWKDFGDPILPRLVEEAVEGNRNLRATAQRLFRAEADARVAGSRLLPELGGNLEASRWRQVFVGFPIPGSGGKPLSTTTDSYGVSLDLSWEVDLWGRLEAGSMAALHDFKAALEEYRAATLSLIGQTSKAWFALREAVSQSALARKTVESHRQTLELVEERFRQGRRPAMDVHLSRQLLAQAETRLSLRLQIEDRARRQCELLLGRYPAGSLTANEGLPGLPPPPPAGLPSALLDRRPDLRALGQRLLAGRFRLSEARAALYPRLSLTSRGGTASNEVGDLLDGDFGLWTLLGNLVQPIFTGGRLRAQVAASQASLGETLNLFANRVLEAFSEVETALVAGRFLAEQGGSSARALKEARSARELAEKRYLEGSSGILELLGSERQSFEAESRLLDLQRLALEARIDLHLALGGGFEVRAGGPAKGGDE